MSLKPILVAEDDSNDVFVFWRYHKQCRIHNPVETFSDGEDVVAYFQRSGGEPALLMLDLKMPRMDGLQVLAYLKTLSHGGFPKIILTSSQDLKLMNTAYQLGAYSFLMKPLDKREFCEFMAKVEGIVMDGCVENANPQAPADKGR